MVGPVHLLHHIPSLQLLVLATEQSQLVTLPTRPVISGSTSLEPQPVPDITRCHIFSCNENPQVG